MAAAVQIYLMIWGRRDMIRAIFIGVSAMAIMAAPAIAAGPASGTVDFTFTKFRGPYAGGSGQYGQSSVNGVIPTRTGAVGVDGVAVSQGTLDLPNGTTSVTMQMPRAAGSNALPITNNVTFTPSNFSNVITGQDFVLGTISYTNGTWWGASPNADQNLPTYLDFQISTYSTEAAFNQVLTGYIELYSNTAIENADDYDGSLAQAQDEADILTLKSFGDPATRDFGSLRVYDAFALPAGGSNTGTATLMAHFGSLDLVGFADPGGGGFLVDNSRIGPITSGPTNPTDPSSAVPEPATWAMLLVGFGVIGCAMRGRRQTVSIAHA
jgi:hypothetical protein